MSVPSDAPTPADAGLPAGRSGPGTPPGPAPDDRTREAVVRWYRSLDAPADGTFARIARIAAAAFATPIATVTIVDEDAVWLAAAEGLEGIAQVGTEPGLCTSAVLGDGPYVVNDAAVDPRTLAHPLVRGELGLRFYAAAPVVTADGHALGTVNVIDRRPRAAGEVSARQLEILLDLAGEVADVLEMKLHALRVMRAERELREQEVGRREAAEAIAGDIRAAAGALRGRTRPATCQLGGAQPCPQPPDLKIADSWGDSAWGCFLHGEDALINVPSVFLATDDGAGIAAYQARRARLEPGPPATGS